MYQGDRAPIVDNSLKGPGAVAVYLTKDKHCELKAVPLYFVS